MTTSAFTPPPQITREVARAVSVQMIRNFDGPFDGMSTDDSLYAFTTVCWKCQTPSIVWFEQDFVTLTIGERCLRSDVRREITEKFSTPLAHIGQVTTKAGGTYLGFTCNACHAVLGKHFLKVELCNLIAGGMRSNFWVHSYSSAPTPIPETALSTLDESVTPEDRAALFALWRWSISPIVEHYRKTGRMPEDLSTKLTRAAVKLRLRADEGRLSSQQVIYLDTVMPPWRTAGFPRKLTGEEEALVEFLLRL
ncbi:hypothetical protein [Microbacterium sp. 77mftsu3.1]|uniref:hypothetical protein n=1 Tax=Microbacterium sp. 77mftsu3.1 TaxID=1761802 RepID=UPI0003618884|nr:hypothetical protein [Microbacterium sp. 77mftsu3.1]SDH54699.1 hypothetical protein SAMN04488590_3538 [Microbacterium sp. 77mftsu3.1]